MSVAGEGLWYKRNMGYLTKLDGVGPIDRRPSTAEAQPIGKLPPFSKIVVILEPGPQF